MGVKFCFLPAILMPSTFSEKNIPRFRWTKWTFLIRHFFHPTSDRISSNCLFHKRPTSACPYKSRSRGTTGSSILNHDFGHLCRGRRIPKSWHSDFGILSNLGTSSIFTWVCADTASAACPSLSGSNDIHYFSCSHLWRRWALFRKDCIGSRVVFSVILVATPHFEMTNVRQCSKVDFIFVSLCFQNTLLLVLNLNQPGIVSDFFLACSLLLSHPKFASLEVSE